MGYPIAICTTTLVPGDIDKGLIKNKSVDEMVANPKVKNYVFWKLAGKDHLKRYLEKSFQDSLKDIESLIAFQMVRDNAQKYIEYPPLFEEFIINMPEISDQQINEVAGLIFEKMQYRNIYFDVTLQQVEIWNKQNGTNLFTINPIIIVGADVVQKTKQFNESAWVLCDQVFYYKIKATVPKHIRRHILESMEKSFDCYYG